MSVPKRTEETDPEYSVEEMLHTESVFSDKNVENITAFLKRTKSSGKLTIDINRGGVTRVSFLQKQPVEIDYGKT